MTIAVMRDLSRQMKDQQRNLALLAERYPTKLTPTMAGFMELFETIFSYCPMPVWAKDEEGRRIAQNHAYTVLYGVSPEQALGRVDESWAPQDQSLVTFSDADDAAMRKGYTIVDEAVYNPITRRHEHLHVPKWRVTLNDGARIVVGCVAGQIPAPILTEIIEDARHVG